MPPPSPPGRRHTAVAPTGLRTPTRDADCGHCGQRFAKLFMCSLCGSAAYCGKACQKAAWRGHKGQCTTMTAHYTRPTGDGLSDVLHSRQFGGLYSLVQTRCHAAHGRGVLVVRLSHPADAFAVVAPGGGRGRGSRGSGAPRRVSFEGYVSGAAALAALSGRINAASGVEAGTGLLDGAMLAAERLVPAGTAGAWDGALFVMVIVSPVAAGSPVDPPAGGLLYHVALMMSWLSPAHPAHGSFQRDPMRTTEADLLGATLNWETQGITMGGPTIPPSISIISPAFYADCQRRWAARDTYRGAGPWLGGSLVPPFAQSFSLD